MPEQTPFLPSQHGFAFTNSWPDEPAVVLDTPFGDIPLGNARGGLCGGMVFAAMDYWKVGRRPPTEQPAGRSPAYDYLVKRLLDSWNLPNGVAQYYQWMTLPDADKDFTVFGHRVVATHGVGWRTVMSQWPDVRADLDRDLPSPLGVVTVASKNPQDLGHNHQVLAYRYETDGDFVTVYVYDPNRGQRDDITIRFSTGDPSGRVVFEHDLDLRRKVRGFFSTPYSPRTPPRGGKIA
jgi:hypothetical protein